jgi:UDP-3-O-[3-hydroxymyristoyl] glucosamine N-acyltransferase
MPTLAALAAHIGGDVVGDGTTELDAIMPLEWAGPGHLSFFANGKYIEQARATRASALVCAEPFSGAPANLLIHPKPYFAAAKLAQIFNPTKRRPAGIHPSAVIDPAAQLGKNVYVGAQAVIEAGAEIGDDCQIWPQVFIGENVRLGKACVLYPGVRVLENCMLGDRCTLNTGVAIGGDGFGFAEDDRANDGQRWHKVPQLGIVMIGDDVEIGANSTVDRATFGATVIKNGCKIDNLVMVAHNVELGEDCALVAQVGVSGSTKLGKRVLAAGQAGFVGHLKIGDDVKVGAQSGVTKSVAAGESVAGTPHVPARDWRRQQVALRYLDEMRKRVLGTRSRTT